VTARLAGGLAEGAADPAAENVVENGFLDGRVRIRQPVRGYRAATDPVLLAAAVPARPGDAVLDLGCGVATAALCLGARVEGVELQGLELQPGYARLARENAALNGRALAVHGGDLRAMPAALRQRSFDGVMLNPPWHAPAHPGSPNPGRDIANRRGAATVADWIDAALARTRPGGAVVVIMRAEGLPEILAALGPRAAVAVLPLAARPGRDAKRVLVRARKGARAPFRLAAPLILHHGAAHMADGDDHTAQARAILREAAALDF
jgi:tRNA1Val (adenine37-N6)-methyltransferase